MLIRRQLATKLLVQPPPDEASAAQRKALEAEHSVHHYTQISESVQYARLFRLFAVTGPYDDTDVRETHAVSAMKQWLGLQEPVPPTQCAIEDMTEATMNFLGQVLQLGYKIAGRSTLEHKVP